MDLEFYHNILLYNCDIAKDFYFKKLLIIFLGNCMPQKHIHEKLIWNGKGVIYKLHTVAAFNHIFKFTYICWFSCGTNNGENNKSKTSDHPASFVFYLPSITKIYHNNTEFKIL